MVGVQYHQIMVGGSQSGRVEKSGRVSQQTSKLTSQMDQIRHPPQKIGKPPLSRHMAYQVVSGTGGGNFGVRDNSIVDSGSRESAN